MHDPSCALKCKKGHIEVLRRKEDVLMDVLRKKKRTCTWSRKRLALYFEPSKGVMKYFKRRQKLWANDGPM